MTLRKEERLRKGYEIKKVLNEGKVYSDSLFKIFLLPSDKPSSRLGIMASRKIGNAVQRNRVRRLFREAFRALKAEIKKSTDVVVLPRLRARETKLEELKQRLKTVFERT